jgi:tetratricopeptide (TPR) repeat protein
MHWQVAEAIESRHVADVDAHLDALAHHFSEGALAGDPAKAIEYGRRAAAKATADLAFEAAVRHLDRAVGALELVTAADPALRLDLQLELGAALRAANDPRQREVGLAAAETAKAMGDPRRLAVAAIAMTTASASSRAGNIDTDLVALLELALDGLPDETSPTRARLLAALATELFWSPLHKQRQHQLAADALEMARRTGDAEALQAVLLGGWLLIDGSEPFLDTMTRYYAEAEAQDWDDPVSRLTLRRGQLAFAAAKGEAETALAHVERNLELGEALRQPRHIFGTRIDQAMMSAFVGELATSEQQTIDTMTYGFEHGVPEETVMGAVGGIFYMMRRAQGRIDELIPALQNLVETQPGAPVWRIALAVALSESDRITEAREQAEYLSANGCANVPPDVEYPVTISGLARLTRTVPLETESMRHIYEHLLPFAGTYNWSGTTVTDANDHGLAVVSARLGDFDASDSHFAAAVALGERSGARPYLASCHHDWAQLLAERSEPAAAADHARRALAISEEIGGVGPTGVVIRARALLESLPVR